MTHASCMMWTTTMQEKLSSTGTQNRLRVHVKKTEVTRNQVKRDTDSELNCILHTNSKHALSECYAFRAKAIEEWRQLLKDNSVHFRWCGSKAHLKRDCGSRFHCSASHILKRLTQSTQQHGGVDDNKRTVNIVNKCTEVCGSHIGGKSCAKILPINVTHIDYSSTSLNAYMILDEQSSSTLVRSELLDYFDIHSTPKEYTLSSSSGKFLMSGRRATGFVIQSLDRKSKDGAKSTRLRSWNTSYSRPRCYRYSSCPGTSSWTSKLSFCPKTDIRIGNHLEYVHWKISLSR